MNTETIGSLRLSDLPLLILFEDHTIIVYDSTNERGPGYFSGTISAVEAQRLVGAVLATGLESIPDELDLTNIDHPTNTTFYLLRGGRWIRKFISGLHVSWSSAASRCAPRPAVEAYDLLANYYKRAPIANRRRWQPSFVKVYVVSSGADARAEVSWPPSLPRPPKSLDLKTGGHYAVPARHLPQLHVTARLGFPIGRVRARGHSRAERARPTNRCASRYALLVSRELACLVAISIALASCRARGNTGQSPPAPRQPASNEVSSNLLRGDYAGSGECSKCHPEIYDSWRRSPMHGMTRNATGAAIRAPFNGAVFRFKGGRAVMETIGRQRFVRLFPTLGGEALYRVTRVIGGRYREDYVGIEVTGAADPETASGRGEERIMPVSYVLSTRSWRYKGYSVLVKERPRLQVAGVWRQTCLFCHNTVPYLSTLYDDLLGRGARGYQGSMTNDLLPTRRRWRAVAMNASGLRRAVVAETEFLGGDTGELDTVEGALAASIETTRARFGPDHLIEIGIGCESCHNGSREHVANPRRRPTFEVRSSLVKEVPTFGTASRAQSINRVCMRCHTVLFSRYPYTWEGGHRYRNPGGSNINSGEARDFVLGGCASQLSCSRCHDPHAKDDTAGLEALAGDAGNRLCVSCHAELSSPRAIAAHTHHDPAKAGSACVGCHMPRKNLGLGYRLTRYHRIGTPADRQRVERDRPLECALCHPDRDVASLVEQMERWWGRRYDRARLRSLYGDDLAVNALRITLVRGKPHEQAVAAAVLGKTGDPNVGFPIATLLAHPYPLIRRFAAQALADLYGRWPAVDLDADVDVIRSQARAWLLEAMAR